MLPIPGPVPGQAVIRIEAIGVNFIDVYHRAGLYPIDPPFSPGSEAAGVVTAVGDGVTEVQVGDRVAHAMVRGSYAEMQAVDAWRLVRLPDRVDARQGAAIMLQGMTAHYLCHSTFRCSRASPPWSTPPPEALASPDPDGQAAGATVYGTVSTEEKAALAREAGADETIRYTEQDFEEEVSRLTDGKRRQRRLRFGRPIDVRQESELPESARLHGVVRAVQRTGPHVQSAAAVGKGLSLPDPADAGQLRGDP